MAKKILELSPAEWAIMQVVWENKEVIVRDVADNTRVLLRFVDASSSTDPDDDLDANPDANRNAPPALAVRPLGQGRVAAAAFSPASNVGELGKYGAFVVLAQSMAHALVTGSSPPHNVLAGHALHVPADHPLNPDADAPQLLNPRDQAQPSATFTPDAGATLSAARDVGFYRFKQGPATLGLAAVNLDPRETNLAALNHDALVAALQDTASVTAALLGGTAQHAAAVAHRGQPLWAWLVLAALGLLTVESTLLGGWRR